LASARTTEPFGSGRAPRSLQSPDIVRSLALRPEWVPAAQNLQELAAPAAFTGLAMPLPTLMFAIQEFLKKEQFEFFHPDGMRYIARRADAEQELSVRIQAAFVPGTHGTDGAGGEIDCELVGLGGSEITSELFVDRFKAMLADLHKEEGHAR
jgi:hypothetical protein